MPPFEVADVIRSLADDNGVVPGLRVSRAQQRILTDLAFCRTARLGGHLYECVCGDQYPAYNSCRNRHCPKCQLHTWGQKLVHHPHIHFVIPGGGLSPDGARWVACRKDFFLPVRVLSRLFRGKLLAGLRAAFDDGRLEFHGAIKELADSKRFARLCHQLRQKECVVYAKRPFGGPEQVLKYLAAYTHRVAITNNRITDISGGTVSFRYKDYANGSQTRIMKLAVTEFLRRFLQHVLPKGYVRIRHFGVLANRNRKEKLALCRKLIARDVGDEVDADQLAAIAHDTSVDTTNTAKCPKCGATNRRHIREFQPQTTWDYLPVRPVPVDTS